MAKSLQICRVCGKQYELCHSLKPSVGGFRWQEVACSPECGAEYLRRIRISRGLIQPEPVPEPTPEPEEKKEALPEAAAEEIPEGPKATPKRSRKKKEDSEE